MKRKILRALSLFLLFSLLLGSLPAHAALETAMDGGVSAAASSSPVGASVEEDVPAYDYSGLYVQKDLVGLFTAFRGGDTVNASAGVWKNEKAGYGDATLKGSSFWVRKSLGVGYTMDLSTWKTYGAGVGLSLPAMYEHFKNFDVEVFATVEGVTDEDGARYVNHYDAEAGTGARYGYYKSGASAFRFGLLSSLFFVTLDTRGDSNSLSSRWYLLNRGYPGAIPKPAESELLANSDTGWRMLGPIETPTPGTMRVIKSSAGVASVTYSVGYSHMGTYSLTVSGERHEELLSLPSTDSAGRFSLFNGLPATVYAVRVYSRVLEEEERKQNAFVDLIAYHGIDPTGFLALDDDAKTRVYNAFAGVSVSASLGTVQAVYDFAVKGEAGILAEALIAHKAYLPILSGKQGYRVLFDLDRDIYNIFTAAGYRVRYGALVSAKNTAPVLGDSTATRIAINGEDGSHLYSDLAGAGAYTFSVALTGETREELETDATVRAYAEVTAPGGEVSVHYFDAYTNETLDGRISIKDAAVYFVNAFDGDVATAYTYMNSAALRRTLAAFDIAGRYALADDLVLYVDAARGKDTNNGRSESTAYATLAAAIAGAKAHLGKPGRKTVEIRLSAGKHYVKDEITVSGEEILADAYSLTLVGKGESTVVTSEREIDLDGRAYDPLLDMSYVQLAKDEDGTYPHFRAVYGNGELLSIAHKGTSEDVRIISDFYIVDGAGNKLATSEKNDWELSAENAARAKYAVMHLPLDLFRAGVSAESYAGAEIHFLLIWTSYIVHIDHVEFTDSYAKVSIAYHEFPTFNTSHRLKGRAAWLENSAVLLADNPDTYYYDRETGRLYYNEGEHSLADFSTLSYAGLDRIFTLSDVRNFTVENLAFTGLDSKYITPENSVACGQGAATTLRYSNPLKESVTVSFMEAAPVFAKHIDGLTVRGVTVNGTLGSGVVCKGRVENVVIDSCAFTHLGNSAIHLGDGMYSKNNFVKGVEITNNYVYDIGTLYEASVAIIATYIANARVIGNTVTYVPYSAFSFGWLWSTVGATADAIVKGGAEKYDTFALEIAYNYVSDFMMCMGDGGAFYLLGGTVTRAANDKAPYNFMHHNYVNVTQETGMHDAKHTSFMRYIMAYYHDNSSSNWLDKSNVLIHTAKETADYRAVYHQSIVDCEAQNNICIDNYYIGFRSLNAVYYNAGILDINADFGITMSDYIYRDAASLLRNESIGIDMLYCATSKLSRENASGEVAAIFAASGSTLSNQGKESGLSWTAPAAEREIYLETGALRVQDIGKQVMYRVTLTDGEKKLTLTLLEGALLGAQEGFVREGHDTVFKVHGNKIDPRTYAVKESVTVNVTYAPKIYPVKFYSVIDGVETVYSYLPTGWGLVILPPAAPASIRDAEGNIHVFVRWEGYTEGMTLETEGASFKAIFRNDGKHLFDDGHDTVCNDCGETREPVHDFLPEWQKEGPRHYHVCSGCDERTDEASHTFDGGAVTQKPTASERGERTFTCTVCGFERKAYIDAPPVMTEAPASPWQKGASLGLAFRSDALFSDFLSVSLDGATLAAADYTVSEGSTVVSLSAAYLATLSAGEHTVTIHSASGDASATFTVTEVPAQTYGSFPLLAVLLPVLGVAIVAVAFFLLRKKKK